jgi:hypothetical protein
MILNRLSSTARKDLTMLFEVSLIPSDVLRINNPYNSYVIDMVDYQVSIVLNLMRASCNALQTE